MIDDFDKMILVSVSIVLALSELCLGQVWIAPEFGKTEACVGTLKAYKVRHCIIKYIHK